MSSKTIYTIRTSDPDAARALQRSLHDRDTCYAIASIEWLGQAGIHVYVKSDRQQQFVDMFNEGEQGNESRAYITTIANAR
jgi:hypothetical protein